MKVEKLTSRIGAEVTGVDLSQPLDDSTVAAILAAFRAHSVLVFAGQEVLSGDAQLAFARRLGQTEADDFQTHASGDAEVMTLDQIAPKGQGSDRWHTDSTYRQHPPEAIMIQAHQLPESGGDTLFASMSAAYEGLSAPIRHLLDDLVALHSTALLLERTRSSGLYAFPEDLANLAPVRHPVIAVHPATGRRFINVNAQWTTHIDGLEESESKMLLDFLFEHVKSPEYQVRHRWRTGDVALWDNVCLQHYAVADYTSRRVVQRVILAKVHEPALA